MKKNLLIAFTVLFIIAVTILLTLVISRKATYSFGQWVADTGMAMTATEAHAKGQGITNLDGLCVYTDLKNLDLSNNHLTNIPSNSFRGLNRLKRINLRENNLTGIEPDTFRYLNNLKTLDLCKNQLTGISQNIFCDLNNLRFLQLDSNRLTSIDSATFNKLDNLRYIYLNNNQLRDIKPDTFSGLSNLQSIWLNRNKLCSIASTTFSGLDKLESLWLDYNQLTNIAPGVFCGLSSLQYLSLHENQLKQLNLEKANFEALKYFRVDITGITRVDLNRASLSQDAFETLTDGGSILSTKGKGLDGITTLTELTIAGADFSAVSAIRNLANLNHLTTLNLSNVTWSPSIITDNYQVIIDLLDAMEDDTLSKLTIDKNLYHTRQSDFDAWAAIEGNTLTVTHMVP